MKRYGHILMVGITLLGLVVLGVLGVARAQSIDSPSAPDVDVFPGFSYQGYLELNGAAVNGTCDMVFTLHDSLNGGLQIGGTQTVTNVAVSKGRFNVVLNANAVFGAEAFNGAARWLAIQVRCPAGSGTYTALAPRQLLRATPYALSLRPGAVVRGAVENGAALTLANSGAGNGLTIDSVGGDGIFICAMGGDTGCTPDPSDNGVEIGSAEGSGIRVNSAGSYGVNVGSTGLSGVRVGSTGGSGVYVESTGISGVYVASSGTSGVFVQSAGTVGVFVSSAAGHGVYANTNNASGEWGVITPDKISGSNVTALSYTLIAQVAPGAALEPGQVVAALGLGQSLSTSPLPVALVGLANDPSLGLAGVVEARLVFETMVDEAGYESVEMHSAPGAALPGEYVLLTVAGVAQVLAEPGAVYTPGMRLAVTDGFARPMETRTLDGMLVSEGAPELGTVLEGIDPETGLLPVFLGVR